jgi:hypothetical protein
VKKVERQKHNGKGQKKTAEGVGGLFEVQWASFWGLSLDSLYRRVCVRTKSKQNKNEPFAWRAMYHTVLMRV